MTTTNKEIGRVLSVDNFRVYIKIDENLRGAYKSGIYDIYEIARINSYLIIPVGADRVVALITRVTMKEEVEFDKNTKNITLPSSARYISATMLGTITKQKDSEKFIQGVYNFPSLDNPVWYVTEKDLQLIFDDKQDEDSIIDYVKDFYLPIGTSPAFSNFKVKICPDIFFAKHAAILGNTGSGKSCTITSILRNLFKYDYNNGSKLHNAHIVIIDTNGEYKEAFLPDNVDNFEDKTIQELQQINTYYYGGDGEVKIPYWFMNWADLKYLLNPSEGAQAPVLNRAVGLAKNEQECSEKNAYSIMDMQRIRDIYDHLLSSSKDYWKIKNFKESIDDIIDRNIFVNDINVSIVLKQVPINEDNQYDIPAPSKLEPIIEQLRSVLEQMDQENQSQQITNEQNIDLPVWFSYQELCTKFIDAAISQENISNNKIAEYISTLRLRMNSFLNDKRIAIPLMLKDNEKDNRDILSQFIAFILGDFNKQFGEIEDNSFIKQYNDQVKKQCSKSNDKTTVETQQSDSMNGRMKMQFDKTNQITIVDVSQLPFDVLEVIVALLGRLIIEFVSYFLPEDRGKYPIVIVLEEAQNYIAEEKESTTKTVFERIAREGRKYGISLIVSSQRPSELSKTVLSQCNSFVIHRLQNPDDQKYVKGLISSANADILDQLPILPQQHAIITGDCVRTPIQVRIDDVFPTPNSKNPKFIEQWLKEDLKIPYEETCNRWLSRDGETNSSNEENTSGLNS